MKTGTFAIASAMAFSAIIAPVQVTATECSTFTLVATFLPLLNDANACASKSGFTLFPLMTLPTADELERICADTACTKVLKDATALDLPDCTVSSNGVAYNIEDELKHFASVCGVTSS